MKNNNSIYKTANKTLSKKQRKIISDDTKHYPNKNEAKLLRKLKKQTGLSEDEIRSYKKYRKMLSKAQKKSTEPKYSDKYKFYRNLVNIACMRTELPNEHPDTLKELENVIHEYNNGRGMRSLIYEPQKLSPKSAKNIVNYVNKNKK